MKNVTAFLMSFLILSIATIFISSSCNKKFDAPPHTLPANLTPNISIRNFKALHTGGNFELINNDYILQGVIVADDKSGNYYKEIVIEDSTGGIVLLLNGYDLYTDYPSGRKIFIKAKGLYLGDYNGLIQLGGSIDSSGSSPALAGIATNLFDTYLFKGTFNNVVNPHVVSVSQLTTNMFDTLQSTLIQLNNFQFSNTDTAKPYADTVNHATVNFTLQDCAGETVSLRNSGYANFAGLKVPDGNGNLNAIYAVYGTTKELFIRDTSDVQFYNDRCDGSNPYAKVLLSQDFSSVQKGVVINLAGWQNIAENTKPQFVGGNFSSSYFATISAYKTSETVVKTWLITPAINLDTTTNEALTFATIDGYDNGATLQVFISSNYDGGSNPENATWTQLPAAISSGHTSSYATTFLPSGSVDISSFSGNVYIAFVYQGADPAHTTTYEISSIKVTGE
jgi:hypothetical protein